MKCKKSFLTLLALLLFLVAPLSLQAEVTATASLNVKSFPVDRAAKLTVSVQGQRASKIEIPVVEGLRFHQRGQSTRMEIINGAYSSSVSTLFLVEASREGKYTIPAITVNSKEGAVTTAPIHFEVTAVTANTTTQMASRESGSATRLRSGEAAEVAFLRVTPAKTESYSGEIVPIEIKVYFREGIQANLNSMPQLEGDGFVLQQLQGEPHRSREVVGKSRYSVLTWNSALSGIKEGEHVLSMELDATLLLRQQQRVQRPRGMFADPFFDDSFFNSFFGSYREKEVKVASPKLTMTVLSLPETGRPDTFTGAIGDFRMQVRAEPLEIAKGDPVTLSIIINGEGNFDRVQAPELQKKKGWKSYSPSSEFLKDGNGNRGKKLFEQALVAKNSDLKEVPAVAFSYFDPESGTYKELISAPIPLTMQKDEKTVLPVAEQTVTALEKTSAQIAAQQLEQPIPGLAPLQLDAGKMNKQFTPLFTKRWFQVLCVIFLLATCVTVIVIFRKARFTNSPQLQRQKNMRQLLHAREQEIEKYLQSTDSRGFLASCRVAIQEQLGQLWDMEAGAITLADLQKRLPQDSVLCVIFSAAEESAYSGQELSKQQMQEFADSLKKELTNLQ